MEWFVKNYLNYESKKYVSVANKAKIGDVWMWNASVGLQNDRWEVTAYVNNILDDETPMIVFDFPLFDFSKTPVLSGAPFPFEKPNNQTGMVTSNAFLITPRRSRNAGVTLRYRFGG
jgi:hypothetical protein